MKKIIVLLIVVFAFQACSVDNNEPNVYYEVLPISNYVVPQEFTFGQTYAIDLYYKRPTTCHFYQGVYFEKNENIRTIGVQTGVREINGCETLNPETTDSIKTTFNFKVAYHEPYTFKFYKGKNEQGQDLFNEVIIPVIN